MLFRKTFLHLIQPPALGAGIEVKRCLLVEIRMLLETRFHGSARQVLQFGAQLFLHRLIAFGDGQVVFQFFPGIAGQLARRKLRQGEVNLLVLALRFAGTSGFHQEQDGTNTASNRILFMLPTNNILSP